MADSLVEANRALYDSTGPQLGYARINCLYARAWSLLGREQAGQVVREAEETVRARHSPSEVAAVNQGLQGNYPTPTPEVCKGVDSSWYARAGAHSAVRPKP